ncbi:MAG TPA: hypothetical protein PK916_08720 [Bacteroidota bacterium]|nr:hypothetical protein [Bacteroidota bacterium]
MQALRRSAQPITQKTRAPHADQPPSSSASSPSPPPQQWLKLAKIVVKDKVGVGDVPTGDVPTFVGITQLLSSEYH